MAPGAAWQPVEHVAPIRDPAKGAWEEAEARFREQQASYPFDDQAPTTGRGTKRVPSPPDAVKASRSGGTGQSPRGGRRWIAQADQAPFRHQVNGAPVGKALQHGLVETMMGAESALRSMILPEHSGPTLPPLQGVSKLQPIDEAGDAHPNGSLTHRGRLEHQSNGPYHVSRWQSEPNRAPTSRELRPRWGSSEGGRDRLGWVRGVLQNVEEYPLQGSDQNSDAPDEARRLKPQWSFTYHRLVYTLDHAAGRENMVAMGEKLQHLLSQIMPILPPHVKEASSPEAWSENRPRSPFTNGVGDIPIITTEAMESLMHIYHSALEDLLGHVAIECRERALMLSLLWDHFSSLVVVYMRLLLQEREERAEIDISGMEEEIRCLKQDLRAKNAEKKAALADLQDQVKNYRDENLRIALKLVRAQKEKDDTMVTLVAEVKGQETQKERVATVVDKIQVLKVEKDENVKKAEKAEAELRIVIKIKERQEKELKTFKDELDLNAASLSEARMQRSELYEQLAEAEKGRLQALRDIKELEQLNKSLEGQLSSTQTKCKDMEEWVARSDKEIAQTKSRLKDETRARETAEGKIAKNNEALLSANAQAAKDRASLKDIELELSGATQNFEQEKSLIESKLRTAELGKNLLGSEIAKLQAALADHTEDKNEMDRMMDPLTKELKYLRTGLRRLGATLEGMGSGNFDCGPGSEQDKMWNKGGMDGPAVAVVDAACSNLGLLSEQSKKKASISRVSEERVAAEITTRLAMEKKMEAAIKRAEALKKAKEALQASSAEAHNDRLEMERRLREAQALNTTLEKQCRELETDAKLANDQLNSTKAILSNFQNALGNPGEARANLERLKENVAMEQQRVAELLAQRAKDVDAMQQLEEQSKDYREHIRTLNEKVKDLEDVKQSLLDTTKELEYEHIAYQQLEEFSRKQAHRLSIAKLFLHGLSSDQREVQVFEPGEVEGPPPRSPMSRRSSISRCVSRSTSRRLLAATPPSPGRRGDGRQQSMALEGDNLSPFSSRPPSRPVAAQDPGGIEQSETCPIDSSEGAAGAAKKSEEETPQHHSVSTNDELPQPPGPIKMSRAEPQDITEGTSSDAAEASAATPESTRRRRVSIADKSRQQEGTSRTSSPAVPISPRELDSRSSLYGSQWSEATHQKEPSEPSGIISRQGSITGSQSSRRRISRVLTAKALIEDMAGGMEVKHSNVWGRVKMAFLTFRIEYYRKKWMEARENQIKTEIEKLEFEENLSTIAIAREKELLEFFATSGGEFKGDLHSILNTLEPFRKSIELALQELRRLIRLNQSAHRTVENLAKNTLTCADGEAQTESTDVETIMISANRWGVMIEAMPRELPANKVSSRAALVAEVADIYKYFMGHVQDSHDLAKMFSGAESAYDVLLHYFGKGSSGVIGNENANVIVQPKKEMFLPSGRIGTFLSQCFIHAEEPRLAMFLRFFGISAPRSAPLKPALSLSTFFWTVNVLAMIRKLLGVNAAEVFKPFPTLKAIQLPLACVLDIICNLYNLNEPASLDLASTKVADLVSHDSKLGMVVGLDELLEILVEELESGAAPRALFRHPRRTMDGRLSPLLTADEFVRASKLKRQLASNANAGGGDQHYGLLRATAEEEEQAADEDSGM